MSAKHHLSTRGFHRRCGVSRLMRAASAVLGCLWLTAPFAHAMDSLSLSRQNQLSAPYPSSYSKEALAKIARKFAKALPAPTSTHAPAPAPAPVQVVVRNSAPPVTAKRSVLELAMQERTNPAVYDEIERTPMHEPSPALMEAIIGSGHATSAHTKVKIGYGKAIADNSDTVGMKNGTRLQEPGCLYVKTSVNF